MLLLVLGKVKKKKFYFKICSSSLLVSISFEYRKRNCVHSYIFSPFCFCFLRMMVVITLFVSVVIVLLLKSWCWWMLFWQWSFLQDGVPYSETGHFQPSESHLWLWWQLKHWPDCLPSDPSSSQLQWRVSTDLQQQAGHSLLHPVCNWSGIFSASITKYGIC